MLGIFSSVSGKYIFSVRNIVGTCYYDGNEDSGTGLLTGLETAGAKPLMENQDFFVLGLQPNPNPMLPEIVKPVRKKHKNHTSKRNNKNKKCI